MSNNEISCFIALWDKNVGARLVDFFPKSIKYDFELITMQIFIAFQNFYDSGKEGAENEKITATSFKLPIRNINRKGSIFLDSFKNEDNEYQPFVVVFLFPGYFSDVELKEFDKYISEIGAEYVNSQKSVLESYYNKILELFLLKEKVQDADIKIDENYSFNDGLLDFKKGMELFSKKRFDQAYILLRKAHNRFKTENRVKLILETAFFLGSILSQLNKVKAALDYYEQLEPLSEQLQHQKYHETSLFMAGFCAFKIEDFEKALEKFKKLDAEEIQFINKFQFYFLFGRVLRLSGQTENAIEVLLKANQISLSMEDSKDIKEKRAKLLLELGHTNYNMATQIVKSGKFDQKKLESYLLNAINQYEDSIEIWKEIDDFSALISTYQLLGNIFNVLNNPSQAIEYYRNALKYAEEINDIASRFRIFNFIVQTLVNLNMHEVIVKEIDEMLSKMISFAFMDLFTISSFHKQIGESLFKLGKDKDALSELLISLNIYNKFETPAAEALPTLQLIIDIYKNSNEEKYISYYEEQYNDIKDKIQETEIDKKKAFGILGEVRELWLILEDGTTLFSYTPETTFDPHLFGSFLCALQSFSKELTSENLRQVTMGEDQFTFYFEEEKPYFVMGRSNIRASINSVKDTLQTLYGMFWDQYKQFLSGQFDGFIGRFSNFRNMIEF